ncbi:hypothetical protein Gogos_003551, partial [Gossypium gossypioides]|nr:hypothetical protein [Gossypium gossypioides]
TKKDAQTTANIVKEIDAEDVATSKNLEEESNDHKCEADVSLDEMDVSATQSQLLKPNQDDSTFSKKNFYVSEQISCASLIDAATLLGENIQTVDLELSRSIASEVLIQEK